jgi:hypothetical protein
VVRPSEECSMTEALDLYFADIFDVDPDLLEAYGAFNISLVNDLPLFIDPFLLFNSQDATYQELHGSIIRYVRFLRDRAAAGEILDGLLQSWFMFREVKQTWLGYSKVGNCGSGLGRDFARALHRNLHSVFAGFGSEEITRSSHLEKLCLIKSGVGRDNISDFTTHLIKDFLLTYTQAFARQHLASAQRKLVAVPKVRFNYETWRWEPGRFELPYHNGDYVILTPKDLLTKDDTWINKADMLRDFDEIAEALPNDQLRAHVNEYLLRCLPDAPKKKDRDEVIAHLFIEYPELLDYYIRFKEEHGDAAVSISEQRVREVEEVFIHNLTEFVETLRTESRFYATGAGTYAEARARVLYLRDVIEHKGGHRLFYTAQGPIRREGDLQILFRLTWYATPADISREVNDGRGPVDFKVSRGRFDKTLVEFKLASNSHLRRNLEKQVAIYERASDAPRSLRVILYFTDSELHSVEQTLKELGLQDNPDIILIDARDSNKPSGSKA